MSGSFSDGDNFRVADKSTQRLEITEVAPGFSGSYRHGIFTDPPDLSIRRWSRRAGYECEDEGRSCGEVEKS